jgi:Diacylglycerol acyltransferase
MSSTSPPIYPRKQSFLSKFFFACLTFWISHLFLFPLFALAAVVAVVRSTEDPKILTLLALCVLLYAYFTYFVNAKAARTGSWFRPDSGFTSFWLGCHSYFPVRTLMWDATSNKYQDQPTEGHKSTYPVNEQTHVFAMAPHGALPVGAAVLRPQLSRFNWLTRKIMVGAADAVFFLPFVREFFLAFGTVKADKKTCLYQLKKGNSILLLPGGIREQLTVCDPNKEDVVVLSDRKGFVKLALETGSPIVPVYVFGERKAFKVNGWVTRVVSRFLKRVFNIGVPLVAGRWLVTLMPFPGPVTLVFGRPIHVPQDFKRPIDELEKDHHGHKRSGAHQGSGASSMDGEKDGLKKRKIVESATTATTTEKSPFPSLEAAVDAIHARFIDELRALYDKHKDACGHKGVELKIK